MATELITNKKELVVILYITPSKCHKMSEFPETLFSVGIMADLQFVDADDSFSFVYKNVRRYRQSLGILAKGAEYFSSDCSKTVCNILLGDVIDAKAKDSNQSETALQHVFKLTVPRNNWHFCVGNHDLSALSRERISQLYLPVFTEDNAGSANCLYYSFSPHVGFRFIFLDPFDVSSLNPSSELHRNIADSLLLRKNPNLRGENRNGNWMTGLSEDLMRYMPYNGMIGDNQIDWLKKQLEQAKLACEKVMIFCHLPCYWRCVHPSGLMWNSEQVLGIIQSAGNVVAWWSGHDHNGGYAMDETGIHHIIPPAPLECDLDQVAFGKLEIKADNYAVLNWKGKVPNGINNPLQDSWPSVLMFK